MRVNSSIRSNYAAAAAAPAAAWQGRGVRRSEGEKSATGRGKATWRPGRSGEEGIISEWQARTRKRRRRQPRCPLLSNRALVVSRDPLPWLVGRREDEADNGSFLAELLLLLLLTICFNLGETAKGGGECT